MTIVIPTAALDDWQFTSKRQTTVAKTALSDALTKAADHIALTKDFDFLYSWKA